MYFCYQSEIAFISYVIVIDKQVTLYFSLQSVVSSGVGYLSVNQKKALPGSLLPHPQYAPCISQSEAKYPLLKYHQNANILFPINTGAAAI